MSVCAEAFVVNAEDTEIFVLLIMLLTILNSPFTAILVPIVSVPRELETLNDVFVPVT